jgi:putative sigma-54 modulation protein
MNITFSAKLDNLSDSTKDYALDKAKKLGKFYSLRKVDVVMDREGDDYCIELVASPEKGGRIVAPAIGEEWLSVIDSMYEKAERQLLRLKEKKTSHRIKKAKDGELESSSSEEMNEEA